MPFFFTNFHTLKSKLPPATPKAKWKPDLTTTHLFKPGTLPAQQPTTNRLVCMHSLLHCWMAGVANIAPAIFSAGLKIGRNTRPTTLRERFLFFWSPQVVSQNDAQRLAIHSFCIFMHLCKVLWKTFSGSILRLRPMFSKTKLLLKSIAVVTTKCQYSTVKYWGFVSILGGLCDTS